MQQLRADEVGGEEAGAEHHRHGQDRAEPGDVHAEPALGLERDRQQQQRLVEEVEDDTSAPRS
jgi:hypothetical protein